MLLLVAYGQRDPNAFFLNQHIRKSFSNKISGSMSLNDVLTWANTSLLRNLFGKYPGKHELFIMPLQNNSCPHFSETKRSSGSTAGPSTGLYLFNNKVGKVPHTFKLCFIVHLYKTTHFASSVGLCAAKQNSLLACVKLLLNAVCFVLCLFSCYCYWLPTRTDFFPICKVELQSNRKLLWPIVCITYF